MAPVLVFTDLGLCAAYEESKVEVAVLESAASRVPAGNPSCQEKKQCNSQLLIRCHLASLAIVVT